MKSLNFEGVIDFRVDTLLPDMTLSGCCMSGATAPLGSFNDSAWAGSDIIAVSVLDCSVFELRGSLVVGTCITVGLIRYWAWILCLLSQPTLWLWIIGLPRHFLSGAIVTWSVISHVIHVAAYLSTIL